jgi:outer membrane protein assembly factor BamB
MKAGRHSRAGKNRLSRKAPEIIILAALVCLLCVVVFRRAKPAQTVQTSAAPTQTQTLTSPPPSAAEESPALEFAPRCVDSTEPEKLLKSTGIMVNGTAADSYAAAQGDIIDFGQGKEYTEAQGIVTFRGNNFRDTAAYGTADITQKKFGGSWSVRSGSLKAPDGAVWTGSGWVGQPLIMTWPRDVRAHMNMYDWAKKQDKLTEVVYATMDGHVYFLDLETGKPTRDALNLGYTFKGAGALDPRGYPILYLGAGYDSSLGRSRAFIINLLDCSVMYEFGNSDSFSLRGGLSFFDGSPLVDAETDQLIYPGESGILYIIKLNTSYDRETGTLSIAPSKTVKWRYYGTRSARRYLGMEDSAVIWRGHLIIAENGGDLFCLDINTLKVDWVQDVLDDTNDSPVLELEDGIPYIYISTSFHYGWRSTGTATIPIWKIDARTGEIVWHTDYTCYTVPEVSGGVQGTVALGKNKVDDLIYVPVARTGSASAGKLAALYKSTGKVAWELDSYYAWSSPVVVYDSQGNGYIVYCTCGGSIYLLDGRTGEKLDVRDLGGNIEASPAVYGSTVVVGTRRQMIYGIKLT